MKKLIINLIISLLILTSCVFSPGLRNTETQLYTNQAGYHITLPLSWQAVEAEKENAVFVAPDNSVSLTIVSELGGEAYYALSEIADMLITRLPQGNSPWQINRTIIDTEEELRLFVQGEDEQGLEMGLDITILQPHPGIRYYLLFAGGRLTISQLNTLIGDIIKSFKLDEELPYLYELMEDWRT